MLTGERGHYELAAGRDVRPYLQAMERFASSTKLLPEQVWSLPDLPGGHMFLGRPTGGAMPLVWAHAEYIKLLRSAADGQVFDLIPQVADRYRWLCRAPQMEIWKFNRQVRSIPTGGILRIQANSPFWLQWSCDQWNQTHAIDSTSLDTGHEYADIRVSPEQRAPLSFTFFWKNASRWEGRDFQVGINERESGVDGLFRQKRHLYEDIPLDDTELVSSLTS
jgi:glucoamylase